MTSFIFNKKRGKKMQVQHGEIWVAKLEGSGSVQNGIRPGIIIS